MGLAALNLIHDAQHGRASIGTVVHTVVNTVVHTVVNTVLRTAVNTAVNLIHDAQHARASIGNLPHDLLVDLRLLVLFSNTLATH